MATIAAPAAELAAVVQVKLVAEPTTTLVQGKPPMLTVAPVTNPVPDTVMLVAPARRPFVGKIAEMVGAGPRYVTAEVKVTA